MPAVSSASPKLTFAFVMDPVENEPMDGSTTIVMMREAQDRGHTVLYVDPDDLEVDAGRVRSLAVSITLDLASETPITKGEARIYDFDEEIDVALQRKDPPVDRDFIVATQIMDVCRKTIVLNRPAAVIAYNEKLLATQFADLMPATRVTRRIDELKAFMAEQGGQMIVKPLDGKGGEGIFHLVADDRNLNSILEQSTEFGTRATMAQEYLPAIRQGDKRILLLEGDPIGAVLRVPAEKESRANLHVGGSAVQDASHGPRPRDRCPGRALLERAGSLLRGYRRDRRQIDRDQRHESDRHPGDQRPRQHPPRGGLYRPDRGSSGGALSKGHAEAPGALSGVRPYLLPSARQRIFVLR